MNELFIGWTAWNGLFFLTTLGLWSWLTLIGLMVIGVIFSAWSDTAEDDVFVLFLFLPILIAIYLVGGTNPFLWALNNPTVLFVNLLQYLLIGVGYAFFRWFYLNYKKANDVKENLEYWQDRFDNSVFSVGFTFAEYLQKSGAMPVASNMKNRIAGWVVWWPFNVISFFFAQFLADFIKMVGRLFYTFFGRTFEIIQKNVYRLSGLDDDLLGQQRKPKAGQDN